MLSIRRQDIRSPVRRASEGIVSPLLVLRTGNNSDHLLKKEDDERKRECRCAKCCTSRRDEVASAVLPRS